MLIRGCKVLLVFLLALYYALVAFGNITDPEGNLAFIGHIMSMDTIFPDSTLTWRAITQPVLHSVAYWIIILWQIVTAVLLTIGGVALWGERDSGPAFQQAKGTAFLGLTAGFSLYLFVFLIVGGEWFAMWQSQTYNAQAGAFRFLAVTGFIFLILLHRDDRASDL